MLVTERRLMASLRSHFLVLLLVTLAALACGARAAAAEYYGKDASVAVYVAWTQSGNTLNGQIIVVSIDNANPARLDTTHSELVGTRDGSDVTLSTSLWGTITGHLGWGTLSLILPTNGVPVRISLQQGSFDDFQKAAERLQQSASSTRTVQIALSNLQEATSRLQSARNSVTSGLTQLARILPENPTPGGVRAQYAAQYAHMEKDWAKVQEDASVAPLSCVQLGQVGADMGAVGADLGAIGAVDGAFGALEGTVNNAVYDVRTGAATIQSWAPVYDARAKTYARLTGRSSPQSITAQATAWAVRELNALQVYVDRWSGVRALKNSYDGRAQSLDAQANNFYHSLSCN
jgi:hypothetical protein